MGIAERLGDRPMRVRLHTNLGQVGLLGGDLGKTLHHAREAEQWARTLRTRETLSGALRLLIRVGALIGDFERAHASAAELTQIDAEQGSVGPAGFTALSLGALYAVEDRIDEAVAAFERAESIFRNGQHELGLMFVLLRRLSLTYLDEVIPAEAGILDEACRLAASIDSRHARLQAEAMRAIHLGEQHAELRELLATSREHVFGHSRAYLDYLLWRSGGDPAMLASAQATLRAVATTLDAPLADACLQRVSLHRRILTATP